MNLSEKKYSAGQVIAFGVILILVSTYLPELIDGVIDGWNAK